MTLKTPAMAAVAVAVCIAATGCGSTKKPAGGGSPATRGASSNATFTYVDINTIMVGWDPSTSYSNELVAMANMYEQLVRYDSRSRKIMPLLATSWSSADKGKTWTFKLRSGATFHTGRPVNAAAVKASILRTKRLNQGAAYEWGPVKSIATPDAHTVVFHLKYAAPLDLIASSAYGAYIFDTKAAPNGQSLGKWFEAGHEAGSGPYELDQWNKGQQTELRLKAYPKYWGGWNGPHFGRLVFDHVPQATTSAQMLESGDATFVQRLNPQLWQQMKSQSGVTTSQTSSFQNLIAFLNTASGPLKDKRVRQAVVDAMDYKGLLSALKGAATAAHGTIPAGLLGYDPAIVQRQNLSQAKSLLQQAGYGPGGKKLTLTLTHAEGDSDESLSASILKSKLAPLNVDVKVQPLEWTSQWDKGKSTDPSKRQDIFVMYWYPDYADPYSWFVNLWKSASPPYFNMSYYRNPALDRRIDALQQLTATNRPAAQKSYDAAQRVLVNDAVALFLYVQNYQRAYRTSFTGYRDNPAYADVVFVHDLKPLS